MDFSYDYTYTLRAEAHHPPVVIIEHHPNDSRTRIADDQNNVQSLTQRMGTGGGNVPLILIKDGKSNE